MRPTIHRNNHSDGEKAFLRVACDATGKKCQSENGKFGDFHTSLLQ